MKKVLMLGAALAPLLAVDAQAGTNLVQNGSFSLNTLPSPLNPSNASGAEIQFAVELQRRSDRLVLHGVDVEPATLQYPVHRYGGD